MIQRHRKKRRPGIPWTWEHVHAARKALEWHLGAGPDLSCNAANGHPCWLMDERHDPNYHLTATNALRALRINLGRLTFRQMDSVVVALDHAIRHPPPAPDSPSPWPFAEALQFLHVWLRDYDPR